MMTGPEVLKIFWQPSNTALPSSANSGAAMIDDRHVHGAEHAIRHRARAGNLQEMASLMRGHGISSI